MEYWSTKYEFTSCIRKYLYLQLYFETKEVSELKYFHRASPFSASKASGSSSPSKKTQLQRTIYLPMYQVVVCRYLFITRPLTCKKVYWKSFFNVGNINPLFMVNHYLESLSGENSFNLLSYIYRFFKNILAPLQKAPISSNQGDFPFSNLVSTAPVSHVKCPLSKNMYLGGNFKNRYSILQMKFIFNPNVNFYFS